MKVEETKMIVGNVVVENEFGGPPLHSLLPRCKYSEWKLRTADG